ncbi:MAG: cobyrinate a,c-diamide synthase [Armatimonadetes bacterium]|nr:cobyrinate a,c-diamide synthase [Armatimonadota bacterium]
MPRLLIAATHSGVGKTTVACGIMAALRRRGLRVAPFKVGPDFLDPGYHAAACGDGPTRGAPAPAVVLDAWMLGEEGVRRSFAAGAADVDMAVIEGMMGLYDGADPETDAGSTAQIARLLQAPVILVLDGSALARSAGALALGYRVFDPQVPVVGVVANRLAGEEHAAYLRPGIERGAGLAFLGWLPEIADAAIPERHLGLVTAGEREGVAALIGRLADAVERHLEVPRLLELAAAAPPISGSAPAALERARLRARIALARDEAFCFYYRDNLALLEAAGAEIVPFSPLRDRELPSDTQGIYLGGGYPELHAARLAANQSMQRAICACAAQGRPIYAECGGLMYLCEVLSTDGTDYPMVGIVPGRTVMESRLQAIGYREVTLWRDTVLGPRGTVARGHEFHHSRYEGSAPVERAAFAVGERRLGYATETLLASYIHLHFGSNPRLAEQFVTQCARRH